MEIPSVSRAPKGQHASNAKVHNVVKLPYYAGMRDHSRQSEDISYPFVRNDLEYRN